MSAVAQARRAAALNKNSTSTTAPQEKSFQKELQQARSTGTLNLANRDLDEIPSLFYNGAQGDDVSQSFSGECPRWWEHVDIRKLFIQCNKLSQIPSEMIPKLANSLTIFDAHENALRDITLLIGDLQFLQSLNLGHNKLSSLPDTIVSLENLHDLNLYHNELSCLPTKWGSLTSLATLILSDNKLSSLPESFGHCVSLSTLILSNNQIQTLPVSFAKLQKLEILDLSFNKLSQCNLDTLSSLKTLKVDHNFLSAIPDVSSSLQLKELSACDNVITSFDVRNVECFRTVSILNLRGNKLTEMPTEVALILQQIERLDLSNNAISMVPPQLGLIESLKSLGLDGNPLRALRRDVVNRGTVFIKQWLVTRLPEPSAAVLTPQPEQRVASARTARSNKQEEAPSDRVDLSNCGSENLTTLLSQSNPSMKELILKKNRLQYLDGMVGSFQLIRFLDLSCNLLSSLPNELSSLSNLRQLNISSNKFVGSLPAVIYSFENLEVLIASDNAFDSFDMDSLLTLTQLSVLDITNNNFPQLDPRISLCPSLKHLEVLGNPFRIPRLEIVRKGSQAILEWLRTKIV